MRSVRISLKTAQWLLETMERVSEATGPGIGFTRDAASVLSDLRAAMTPKKSVKLAKARKETKKKTKRAETSEIREAVMSRAGGQCEMCGAHETNLNRLEMHHALGRVRAQQSVENCLALCGPCHRDITDNRPSAVDVLQGQASKFGQLGLHATAKLLLKRRDFVLARGVR